MARRQVVQIAEEDADEALLDLVASCRDDPLKFVEEMFPWGEKGTTLVDEDGPDEWQREFLGRVREGLRGHRDDPGAALRFATASGHGVGKAQPLSLEIDTADGRRRWGDLKPGDFVFGRDGRPTRVVAVHMRGRLPVFRVSLDDGTSTRVCGEHLWTVRDRSARRNGSEAWETVSTEEIARRGVKRKNGVGTARQWELPMIEPVRYAPRWVPVDPYTLGAWLGDGCRKRDIITSADPEVPAAIRAAGYEVGEAPTRSKAKAYSVRGLRVGLRMLGIFEKGAAEKRVPDIYLRNAPEVRAAVLRGLIDTDGFVTPTGAVIFTTVSPGLAEDVTWLARSLGGKAVRHRPVTKYAVAADGDRTVGRPVHNVTLTMPDGFSVALIRRKAERVRSETRKRYLSRWLDAIEPDGVEECMCITVEADDHLYLTNDFIPTHNSCLVAWVILWFVSTRPNPQIIVTANTKGQLDGKTWRELAKWHRLARNAAWFQWTATKFYFKADPETWFASAVPWTKERAEAFAGTHEKHVLILFDEASAIDDAIWDVSEGAMTTHGAMWMAFGNPTRNTGRFRECFTKFRHRWVTTQVDSRRAKKANRAQIDAWIEDYGEDSDFVRIRVRGEFPRASSTQFIGQDLIEAAQDRFKRALRAKRLRFGEEVEQGRQVRLTIDEDGAHHAAKILTLDVARFGDDESVVGLRKGSLFLVRDRWREKDLMQTVALLARIIEEEDPDAVFIDEVGIGAGVVDRLTQLGFEVIGVNGALKALDERKYFNRRMEMWAEMRSWLRQGGMIEDDQGFADDLAGPEFGFDAKDRLQLESKDDMKARGLPSPDVADALAMSFFEPVAPRHRENAVTRFLDRMQAVSGTTHMSH